MVLGIVYEFEEEGGNVDQVSQLHSDFHILYHFFSLPLMENRFALLSRRCSCYYQADSIAYNNASR